MITCICKSVSNHAIHEAVRGGARTLEDVKQQLGCCGGCGTCEEDVREEILMAKTSPTLVQTLEVVSTGLRSALYAPAALSAVADSSREAV